MGLNVLLVEPGGFRTGIVQRNRFSEQIPAYAGTSDAFRTFVQTASDEVFPGDPARAAKVLIEVVESEQGSRRIIFGSDAFSATTSKLQALQTEYEAGQSIAFSTDFEPKQDIPARTSVQG